MLGNLDICQDHIPGTAGQRQSQKPPSPEKKIYKSSWNFLLETKICFVILYVMQLSEKQKGIRGPWGWEMTNIRNNWLIYWFKTANHIDFQLSMGPKLNHFCKTHPTRVYTKFEVNSMITFQIMVGNTGWMDAWTDAIPMSSSLDTDISSAVWPSNFFIDLTHWPLVDMEAI